MWGGLAPRRSNLLLNGRALRTARFGLASIAQWAGLIKPERTDRLCWLAPPLSRWAVFLGPCREPQPLRKFFAIRLIIEHVEIGQQTCLIETNAAQVGVG